MKKINLDKILKDVSNATISKKAAETKAKASFIRSAKKYLAEKNIVSDTFNTLTFKVPNPLSAKGSVVATIVHNTNPYSDPGSFLTSTISSRVIRIPKSRILN